MLKDHLQYGFRDLVISKYLDRVAEFPGHLPAVRPRSSLGLLSLKSGLWSPKISFGGALDAEGNQTSKQPSPYLFKGPRHRGSGHEVHGAPYVKLL